MGMRTYILETASGDTFPVTAPSKAEALKLGRKHAGNDRLAYIDDDALPVSTAPKMRPLIFDPSKYAR